MLPSLSFLLSVDAAVDKEDHVAQTASLLLSQFRALVRASKTMGKISFMAASFSPGLTMIVASA